MRHLTLFGLLIMSLSYLTQVCYADVQTYKNPGSITVYSNKSKELDPDTAQITFAVKTNAKTVEAASSENKLIADKIISSLKQKLDLTKGDSIKTSDFSVYPQYSYPKDGRPTLIGYEVQNSINVKTKKVSSVGNLIDTAIKNGANQLNNLSFSLSDEKASCDDLYVAAVKDAQNQAFVISRALNCNIAALKSINANCNIENPNRMHGLLMMKGVAAESSSVSTPVESGKIKVNASVTAEFYVQ